MTDISAILLAAGNSSRMEGANKLLLRFPATGKTVLETTLETYCSCGFGEIICVTGRDPAETGSIAEAYGAKVVHNSDFMRGMAHSIVCGMKTVSSSASGILIALADMPFVTKASIDALYRDFQLGTTSTIVLPTFQGQRGNPVLFGNAYTQELMQLSGDVGAKSVVKRHTEKCREAAMPDDSCLRDIDTNEDWKRSFAR